MFDKLKQVGQALSPQAIKQGLAASREAMANGGRLTPEQLAALPPETRARYEASMAQMEANADAMIESERSRRALFGPAGDHLYGPLPDRDRMTDLDVGRQASNSVAEFKDVLRNPLGRRPRPTPSATPANTDFAAQSAHERSAREQARAPYLCQVPPPVTVTRIPSDRKRSIEELAAWLGSSGLAGRPDLVYGTYRVPDHVPKGLGIGRTAIVEWDIVHASQTALPPGPAASVAVFSAQDTWAARRPGEPSVLDEDLGLEYLRFAGVGPEQCLGIARRIEVDASGGGDAEGGGSPPHVMVATTGVLVLHPAGLGVGAPEQMVAARPLQIPPAPDVYVEVLNWSPIRRVVAPRGDRRPLVPSPFPYLPSSPQELLVAYLSVVGVRAQDCYSAQVTVDQPSNIIGGTHHVKTTGADKEVAADGEVRKRFRGGSLVVIVYRDADDYATGRQRWAAYEDEVLQARLANGLSLREPVTRESRLDRGGVGRVLRGVEAISDFIDDAGGPEPFSSLPYFRYCWPPIQ